MIFFYGTERKLGYKSSPSKLYQAGFLSPAEPRAERRRYASLSVPVDLLPRSSRRRCKCRSCR